MTSILAKALRTPVFGGFNGKVVQSVSANALTFAVKTASGADPSADNPVRFTVPDGSGGWTDRVITSALSITIPSGATLGMNNGQSFRIWIALFDDAGTPRLAVKTFVRYGNSVYISACNEGKPENVATSGTSDLAWYNPTTVITGKYWRFIAHATYETPLATAGVYTAAPNNLVLVTESTPRPGTPVQYRIARATVNPSINTSSTTSSGLALSIAPSASCNLMEVGFEGFIYGRTGAASQQAQLILNSSVSGNFLNTNWFRAAVGDCIDWQSPFAIEAPNTTAVVTYTVFIATITSGLYQFTLQNLYAREISA